MKGSHILNCQELPRLRDSISYLYVEHAVIEKGDNAIVSISAEGRMPIPVSGVTCLLLGPGTNVTHAAIRIMADSGCGRKQSIYAESLPYSLAYGDGE